MSKSNHKQETLADIMAGMRYGTVPKHQTDHELLALYADRIEAAAKRESVTGSHGLGNAAAMREALVYADRVLRMATEDNRYGDDVVYLVGCMRTVAAACRAARAAPPHTGKWINGRKYEYEYAYCSACGRMQWADWDTHKQAEESIESFADDYKFCPGCGAKMEGGVYVK